MWAKRRKTSAKELVAGVSNLVALPQVYVRISELLNKPTTTTHQIGDVISGDPALTARLLRFANSPLFGLRTPVDSVARAVAILGIQEVRMLALAASVGSSFGRPAADVLSMGSYWHHSVFTGIVAKQLGKRLNQPSLDRLFVAGLLHDVGQVVIAHLLPDDMRKVLEAEQQHPRPLWEAEQEFIGCGHAEVGSELLRQWNLPDSLYVPICYQYAPEQAPRYGVEAALLNLANAIAESVEPCRRAGEAPWSTLVAPTAWEMVRLKPEVASPAALEASMEFYEMLEIIVPHGGVA